MPPPNRNHPPVPQTTSVRPGAAVHIVLKADQPTGRTVTGIVRDVLTRGNHPRGIKVRLVDGRVGRVQSMAASGVQNVEGDLGRQFAGEASTAAVAVPSQQIGLDAYVKEVKPKRKGGRRGGGQQQQQQQQQQNASSSAGDGDETTMPAAADLVMGSETIVCPVCGSFEGDEAAVSHHVASHFEDNPE